NVEIDSFNGLLVDYAVKKNAQAVLRGMRAVSDFEYEFQLALMNRRLNRDVETVFLMTGLRWIFTSSSIIKEAAKFGGNIEGMVPPKVEKRLKEKFGFAPGVG
ncbi:MAG: pantetheine-phosphate adenylyltransferase, partial [Desulfobacterales bacterium]|nr:pantetheine-phosphate adenylyltransferase [Desulfobacterales bacterium]